VPPLLRPFLALALAVTAAWSWLGAADSVEAAVTVSAGADGTGSIVEAVPTGSTAGYTFLGQEVTITAPVGTATSPLKIVFRLDPSLLSAAGETQDTVQVLRDGTPVPPCDTGVTDANRVASPRPCVFKRETDAATGDVVITTLTAQASCWNVAKVHVTLDRLCDLTKQAVSKPRVAQSLCLQLATAKATPTAQAKSVALGAYKRELAARPVRRSRPRLPRP